MSHTPQKEVIRNRIAKQMWQARKPGTPIRKAGGTYSPPITRIPYVNLRHKAEKSQSQ